MRIGFICNTELVEGVGGKVFGTLVEEVSWQAVDWNDIFMKSIITICNFQNQYKIV